MARHASPAPSRTRAVGKLARRALVLVSMLTLAIAWSGLLILLITLSLFLGRHGTSLRDATTNAMLTPLGDAARRTLAPPTRNPSPRVRRAQRVSC